jgi:5-methylcytosine-specific restriction protein A
VRVAHFADGTTLAGPVLDAMLCDVSVHRVITAGPSQVLDIGRLSRLWPAAIRRAAARLYQGCGAHGCDRPIAFTDLHHVLHWKQGGLTSLDNAIPLCRAHHRLVHKSGWVCAKLGRLWIAVPPTHPLAQPPPDVGAA